MQHEEEKNLDEPNNSEENRKKEDLAERVESELSGKD
jgi:hypothetical protein